MQRELEEERKRSSSKDKNRERVEYQFLTKEDIAAVDDILESPDFHLETLLADPQIAKLLE